ncbi:VCBS repeat-containing protein [Streptomyces sp. NPDC006798]|uniref:FG-GAP repeat domain-containing protein n=1 Tax=Streptomyces sp. NPDC006798 TaxID=3155462 RepID=UPI00340ABA1B
MRIENAMHRFHRSTHRSRPARRTTVAIAVAVAVTAGPLALTAPVSASSTPDRPAATTPAATPPKARNENLPPLTHTRVVSAGETGYLARTGGDALGWVRYADGSVTPVGTAHDYATQFGAASDVVALPETPGAGKVTLVDLSGGGSGTRTEIDLAAAVPGYTYLGAVGSTVIARDGQRIKLVTSTGGVVTSRDVTGLPDGLLIEPSVAAATKDTVLLRYMDRRIVAVDLATASAAAHGDHTTEEGTDGLSTAVSADHIAWVERVPSAKKSTLVVADRATGAVRRTAVPYANYHHIGLTGGWVVYGIDADGYVSPANLQLSAVPATGGTPVRLLDRTDGLGQAPDGSLVVPGGIVGRGDGLYRITGAAGGPTVVKTATTGRPTEITFVKSDVPESADLTRGTVPLRWQLSRYRADYKLTLRHIYTGVRTEIDLMPWIAGGDQDDPPYLHWDGTMTANGERFYGPNGPYEWSLTATPWNRVGPPATASGRINVYRAYAPHDWTNNGSPDLLVTDGGGRLWREDTHLTWTNGVRLLAGTGRQFLGDGWGGYDLIEASGLRTSSATFVARDKKGDFWEYPHGPDGSPADGRLKIGHGWGIYDRVAAGSDLNGDGQPDLVAVDRKGDLWFYPRTGPEEGPGYGLRKKAGHGWGGYTEITAVGDIAGARAGDLVARDKAGVLWLHLGDGKGGFAPRTRIGGGWNEYNQFVGVGDANRDGRPDLYAYGPGGRTFYYRATGDWKRPFETRISSTALMKNSADYKIVF